MNDDDPAIEERLLDVDTWTREDHDAYWKQRVTDELARLYPFSVMAAEEYAREFKDATVDPLVGTPYDALLTADCRFMLYGKGGSTKTTLELDLACHLAAGDPWLGLDVPKPRRVLMIEAEGSQAMFGVKLGIKLAGWSGGAIGNRLQVLYEPHKFTYRTVGHQYSLADVIRTYGIEVVLVGPLYAIGMKGGGTFDEIEEFMHYLNVVEALVGRRFATGLIHHESKVGKVSGAWEGQGDVLMHARMPRNGVTELTVEKARWSSSMQGYKFQLAWSGAQGFNQIAAAPDEEDDVYDDRVVAYLADHPGAPSSTVERECDGKATRLRESRDRLLASGRIVNVTKVDGVEEVRNTVEKGRPSKLHLSTDFDVDEFSF